MNSFPWRTPFLIAWRDSRAFRTTLLKDARTLMAAERELIPSTTTAARPGVTVDE